MALKQIQMAAQKGGISATVCGELAGRPLEALTLLALGYRSISMSPAAIGPVKAAIRAVDLRELRRIIDPVIEGQDEAKDLRAKLTAFAETHGVPI